MQDLFVGLTDEEIKTVVKKCGDFNALLMPIKSDNIKYKDVRTSLGSLNSKSFMVSRNLPLAVVTLVRRYDITYVEIMNKMLEELVEPFRARCIEMYGEDKSVDEYTDEMIYEVISSWRNENAPNVKFDAELIYIQVKVLISGITEERIQHIKELEPENIAELIGKELKATLNSELEKTKTTENTTENKETSESISEDATDDPAGAATGKKRASKNKKITPAEKAAKTKLAELKKKEEAEKLKKAEDVDDIVNKEAGKKVVSKKLENCYIGMIDILFNYYNFLPLGKWDGRNYEPLSIEDNRELLPDSRNHNINIYYNISDSLRVKEMKDVFHKCQLMLFEFTSEDLEENRINGELNQTGYKVVGNEVLRSKKLRFPSEEGLYTIIPADDLADDINTKKNVGVTTEGISEGQKILVNLNNGYIAGPFQVKYSATVGRYYIMPQGESGKGILNCYNATDVTKKVIRNEYDDYISDVSTWYLGYIDPDATPVMVDIATDDALLESFRTTVAQNGGDIGVISAEKIASFKNSLIQSDDIPKEISEKRIERIRGMLSNAETINTNFDQLSDTMIDLLINNLGNDQTDMFLERIIKRDDFLDKIPNIRILKDRIEQYRAELENISYEREQMENEINNIREEAYRQANEDAANQVKDIEAVNERIRELSEKLGIEDELTDLVKLQDKQIEIQKNVDYLEQHKKYLEIEAKEYETSFVSLINKYSSKIVDLTFDGFMSSKMIEAASEWENNENERNFQSIVDRVNSIEPERMNPSELVDYLVQTIQSVRPQYDPNMIVNLLVCTVQGFITVFSGTPGCGKTSICNIIAKALGLNKVTNYVGDDTDEVVNRYIPVSVERGWTSKRDFVGYYNPLTKAFEESNREVFDGLRILNAESKKKYNKFPYLILLDEANLSSMEYYWADFMNVCDDPSTNHSINLGNGNSFRIPETLHFVATINNDHTTETLSPRLIDRAWVITLPRLSVVSYTSEIKDEMVKLVSWEDLVEAFGVAKGVVPEMEDEILKIYEEIKKHLSKMDINISPRVDIAIHRYWCAAAKRMITDDYANTPGMIAFDYIVAQKILPMIGGSGEEYETWLNEFSDICARYSLRNSNSILKDIIKRGNRQLKYFQFFN